MATSAIDDAFLDQEIATLKTMITAIGTAITVLVSGQQSYTLDTGQTRQTVTKADLGSLRLQRNALMNELAVLDVRRNGTGVSTAVPGW